MPRYAEIYPRNPDDPLYQKGLLETDDLVEITIGMIKQIIMTSPGEVLGDPYFGIDLESLLFDFNVSQKQLEEAIALQIYTYCLPARTLLNVSFKIGFFQGDFRDSCVIEFAINSNPVLGIRVI